MNNTLEQQLADLRNEYVNERLYDSNTQVNIDILKLLVKQAEETNTTNLTFDQMIQMINTIKDEKEIDAYTKDEVDQLVNNVKEQLKDYYTPEQIEQLLNQVRNDLNNKLVTPEQIEETVNKIKEQLNDIIINNWNTIKQQIDKLKIEIDKLSNIENITNTVTVVEKNGSPNYLGNTPENYYPNYTPQYVTPKPKLDPNKTKRNQAIYYGQQGCWLYGIQWPNGKPQLW